jgi:hypothetical protein
VKIHKEQAEHYIWGEVCDGWYLERAADRTVIQERMPAGASEIKHAHQKAKHLLRQGTEQLCRGFHFLYLFVV